MNPFKDIVDATTVLLAAARRDGQEERAAKPTNGKRRYDAANRGRLGKTITRPGLADKDVKLDGKALRDFARDQDQNHDVARAILDTHVDNIVGPDTTPFPGVELRNGQPAVAFNRDLRKAYREWCKQGMADGMHVAMANRLACRTWLRDGDEFDIHSEGRRTRPDQQVPYVLQALEGDFVPWDFTEFEQNIIQGIKKNDLGMPLEYYVGVAEENDTVNEFGFGTRFKSLRQVSADNVTHLKFQTRLGQTRGVSILAPVLTRLQDLKGVEEAERIAAKMSASIAVQVIRGTPDNYSAPDGDDEFPELSFQPGMIVTGLQPGERMDAIDSTRPNTDLIAFAQDQLRFIAAGSGVSASTISRNYQGSYSAERQQLVEAFQHYGVLWHQFVNTRQIPIWERFVRNAIAGGAVKVPRSVNRDTLFLVEFSRPVMPWIDPQKEMNAVEKMVSLRIRSRGQIMRDRNWDPDMTAQQVAEEAAETAALMAQFPETAEGSNDGGESEAGGDEATESPEDRRED